MTDITTEEHPTRQELGSEELPFVDPELTNPTNLYPTLSQASDDESDADEAESEQALRQRLTSATQSLNQPSIAPTVKAAVAEGTANVSAQASSRFNDVKNLVSSKVTHYGRNPQELGNLLRTQVSARITDRLLLIFFVIWSPFLIMISGSFAGQLINLFFRNLHYFVGIGAAIYVWILHSGKGTAQQKFFYTFLIASTVPIFMMEEPYFIMRIFTLLAFCGTPYVLKTQFLDSTKENPKLPPAETQLLFATAPAAIFVLATGGESYINHLILALVFGGAAFASERLTPIVVSKIPSPNKEKIAPHQILVWILLEIILANLILTLLRMTILPESLITEENSFFGRLFYTVLGLVFVAASHLLSGDYLVAQFHVITPQLQAQLEKGFLAAIGVSFLAILFTHVIQHWIMTAVHNTLVAPVESTIG